MRFTHQVVWITGASAGIGWALAREFARQGATVAVSARRQARLEALVAEIEAAGGKAQAFPCDILDDDSLAGCVAAIVAALGRLDVAVANAGFGVMGRIEDLGAADWQRQLAGNVTGLALTCKYALPHLRQTQGRLALVGSVAAYVASPDTGAYSASKAAVHAIGETLQLELWGSGVSCTTLHPGFVESDIARVDNAGTYYPDRPDPRPAQLMWPADRAARVMVRAIARRRRVYVFTAHGRIAAGLARFFPGLSRWLVRKVQP